MTSSSRTPRWMTYVPLEQVRPALRNPQGHAIEAMILAMQTFGFTDAPIVDERTERLYAGHGRLEALVAMWECGLDMPEGLMLDPDGTGWLLPLQRGWRSRDDVHAEAALIAHNRLTQIGGQNTPLLVSMLDTIQATDAALFEAVAFDEAAMSALLAQVNMESPDITGEELPDDVPSPADPEPGDDDRVEPDRPTVTCPACQHCFETKP